ncbi:MAG: hypothetical protein JWO05_3006 [Gemmatimonadetes bacterium]|nr:hypothetical protein [Gemmatimonadota bacterium]
MKSLWSSSALRDWDAALAAYPGVVGGQGVAKLASLDSWYRDELPALIAARRQPHVTLPELVKLTEWKMARGVWRAPNLVLVKGNEPHAVIEASTAALAAVPHPTVPIATLAKLHGIGPATASAAISAFCPESYPFFDELVAAQVPGLGEVKWTMGYYRKYAEALRARAAELGHGWTPAAVERALWAHFGGKASTRADLT